jgi:hypothetical protein
MPALKGPHEIYLVDVGLTAAAVLIPWGGQQLHR